MNKEVSQFGGKNYCWEEEELTVELFYFHKFFLLEKQAIAVNLSSVVFPTDVK